MTPTGEFRRPRSAIPLAARVGGVAFLVAILAGALGIAALALWFALAIIPVALVAGAIAYVAFRFQLWRARGSWAVTRRPPGP